MRLALFCLLLVLGANIVAAQSIITIDVNESGNALWTMEKFFPLTTSDLNAWKSAVKTGQNMSKYQNISEYEEIILAFQNSTMNISNRSMEIENFNMTYDTRKTPSGGIIRYTFIWKNFSYIDSEKIYIGDAFPSNVQLLWPDNQFIIKIPPGYEVTNVTPVFDKRSGNLLIWDGTFYNNFSNGGPFIVLSPLNATKVTGIGDKYESLLEKWPILEIVIILLFIMASVAFFRLWKKRHSGKASTTEMVTQVPKEMLHELSEIPGAWTKIVKSIQNEYGNQSIEELEKAAREQRLKNIGIDSSIPFSELTKEDLEDEEMIKQFLLRSGGQAHQSDIVEQSGLSKSKISMVLSKMKDDGIIIKIRKGKENLIRLVPEINEK